MNEFADQPDDAEWWNALGKQCGWTLHAFTDRLSALFYFGPTLQGDCFHITGRIRNSIMKAVEDAWDNGYLTRDVE